MLGWCGKPNAAVVVEIEVADRHRVEERRFVARRLPPRADDARLRVAAPRRHDALRDAYGSPIDGADRAPERVEQDVLRLLHGGGRQILVAHGRDPDAEILQDRSRRHLARLPAFLLLRLRQRRRAATRGEQRRGATPPDEVATLHSCRGHIRSGYNSSPQPAGPATTANSGVSH